jgi:hypothetical protein
MEHQTLGKNLKLSQGFNLCRIYGLLLYAIYNPEETPIKL